MRPPTKVVALVATVALAGGITACSDDSTDSEATIGSAPPESVEPMPQGSTETAPDSGPGDSTSTTESVSSESVEVFNFETDSLCDRISGERVADMVEVAFRAHDATPIPSGFDEEGRAEASGYRYCAWPFDGGTVVLVETEPAEVAREQRTFVRHPALSPGVLVDENTLGYIGQSGEFIDGLEARLLVEGQDSSLEFHHTAPVWYTGDESALLAVADRLLREMNWVPTTVGVFSFAEHDLCEWMSTDDLAAFISAEFDWTGIVEVRRPQNQPGENCEWVLRGETDDSLGSLYAVKSIAGAYGGSVEYAELTGRGIQDQQELGVWVIGHPALDEPALTALAGFGGVAYGFPDDGRIITMWLNVPGHEPDADFFMAETAVANQILHELGWFAAESG